MDLLPTATKEGLLIQSQVIKYSRGQFFLITVPRKNQLLSTRIQLVRCQIKGKYAQHVNLIPSLSNHIVGVKIQGVPLIMIFSMGFYLKVTHIFPVGKCAEFTFFRVVGRLKNYFSYYFFLGWIKLTKIKFQGRCMSQTIILSRAYWLLKIWLSIAMNE